MREGLPKKICGAKIFWEEGAAGVKENSLSLLKLFQNAPCEKIGLPKKICAAKIFWEEGAAGVKENSLGLPELF